MPVLRLQDAIQAKDNDHKSQVTVILKMEKDTQEKIGQLQMFEQSLQTFLGQKQQFQVQLVEVESALSELETTSKAYKIVGNIMVEADKNELKSDLDSKKEMLELRIRTMDKQETQVREKASKLQSEILKKIKKDE